MNSIHVLGYLPIFTCLSLNEHTLIWDQEYVSHRATGVYINLDKSVQYTKMSECNNSLLKANTVIAEGCHAMPKTNSFRTHRSVFWKISFTRQVENESK